jgi:hypothetical protein
MKHPNEAVRDAIIARLALSRAEISHVLEPAPDASGDAPAGSSDGFPRSRTMQALLSGRGLGAVGAMAGGLLLARPALAWRLIRLLPASAVARMLLARAVGAMRGRRSPKP